MAKERAKLFAHGGSQAVRLPKAFRFKGTEVAIRREGNKVILEPVGHDPDAFWARIDALAAVEVSDNPPVMAHLAALQAPGAHADVPR